MTTAVKSMHTPSLFRTEKQRFIWGIILSAISGAMLLLSFPPYGLWPLMWFAIIPYRYAQYRLLPVKWSSLAEATANLVWLGPFMARMFGMDNGIFFYLLGVLIAILTFFLSRDRTFHEKTGYRWFILQGAIAWVGFEMIRATFIPLVATSAFIGYTQSTQPWITQPVAIFSVYGLNLLIMLVGFALSQGVIAWSDRNWQVTDSVPVDSRFSGRSLLVVGVILLAWLGTSQVMLRSMPKEMPTVRVAAIQPGYDLPAFQDEVNTSAKRMAAFADDVRQASSEGAKIIFTPEMLFNFDPQQEFTDELKALAAETDSYLMLTYVISIEGQDWRNESVLLSPTGQFSEVYGKNEIPPGEPYTATAGVYPVFDTPNGELATMICHDANYTETARKLAANGAQLVSAGLNEFGGFGEQYWTNVSFRAIENRTAMVVSTRENGSAIINPDGSLAALDLEREKHAVLVGDVTLGSGKAPYTSLGDILGWVSLVGFVGFMFLPSIIDKKAKKTVEK
ncbi:nitrilase-related carbon-nitrogen hydrolase [Chloroflexota bacterium]